MRTVAVVTTSRADYGHLYWVLRGLDAHSGIELRLIVLGAHLAPEFGRTMERIEDDGFTVHERVECLLSSDTDVGMAKTIGVAILGLADALDRMRPDLLLLIADRYELLAPASAALALRIPIAHIEGGEVSEGAIDHAVRNALTMMSHVHFTPTQTSRRRVLEMGEEEWRVHCSGAPSLDHLRRSNLLEPGQVRERLDLAADSPPVIVAYHPVTLARDTTREADAVFSALERVRRPIVFCFPNADAGSRALIERATAFCKHRDNATLHINLDSVLFWSLLRIGGVMVGNSSSGIMEAPALELPVVNIGMRQRGRERARNIIDVEPQSERIVAAVRRALEPSFRARLAGMDNPYGDGRAAERIVETLATVPLGEQLLLKRTVAMERMQ